MLKIAVIGAGPSGVVMVKELTENGLDVTCFEAGESIGGVYANTYHECQLTTSTLITQFSDFEDEDAAITQIWMATEYVNYLERYVDHFDIRSKFQFLSRVEQISPIKDGNGYKVIIQKKGGGQEAQVFDRVAICTGTNQKPKMPELAGADRFQGDILHSSEYLSPEPFKGKRVLVIGGGESGADISLSVAQVAADSSISVRGKHGYLVPRFLVGNPTDIETARSHHSFPNWWGEIYHRYRLSMIYVLALGYRIFGSSENKRLAPVFWKWATLQLGQHPNGFTKFGTKNLSMVEAIALHGCTLQTGIDRLDEQGVVFTDGSRFDCDAIICATGYQNHFPFLQEAYAEHMEDIKVSRRLFKHCIYPQIGETLFFSGFARPALGALPPASELQARWFALLSAGKCSLPSISQMDEIINRDIKKAYEQFGSDVDRISTLTDFLGYLDDLARIIGCFPDLDDIKKTNPTLWRQILLGPICAAQYRLNGPGAKPKLAAKMLLNLPASRTSADLVALKVARWLGKVPGFSSFTPSATWV